MAGKPKIKRGASCSDVQQLVEKIMVSEFSRELSKELGPAISQDSLMLRRTRCLANDQLGRYGDLSRNFQAVYAPQQGPRGRLTHFSQWLANCRQPWDIESRERDVVKTDNGHILRNTQIGVSQGANGANRRHVVECDNGGKTLAAAQEGLHHRVSQFRR